MIQAVAITLILLSITISGCIFPSYGPRNNTIWFSVSILTEGPTELIIPLPVWQPLLDKIDVIEGDCEYQFVDTPYGDGLWVHVDTYVKISGSWSEGHVNWSTQMSINLTTMVPLLNESPPENAVKHWIPDREFWLNWSSGPLSSIYVSSKMVLGGGWSLKYSKDQDAENLEIGWNKIPMETESRDIQAP